ncbi:single-stranded DNA-binding protein [uncultured Oscillibacter sp.]|uniref:single-stranded DNA-binding protein n=1 Tax=uncultured Oscillibacter sp. TaxID=876091 RepID=UPI001F97F57D|nr:single-stranded DNA-binding protein [uncultured Oscillibacter sp.]HJB77150.1 single-stranded DNA-binding protein [Candidatus Oscillibacter avistercoris]
MTTQTRNEVLLEGTALEAPVLSHENHGTRFYRFPLEVPRLSGTPDTLPVLLPEPLLDIVQTEAPLRVQGQLRSFNNRSGVGNRLVLTVYAQAIQPGTGEPCNRILLSGALCKPPIFRRTPLGRSICDLMLAVSRRYGRADYLPVIAWGQLAVRAARLQVGDPLSLEGRVQSRAYRKVLEDGSIQDRVAYEVSAMHLLEPESAD